MYYGTMPSDVLITVTAGHGAVFFPAPVPLSERREPGLRFELAPGRPWQWAGEDGPAEASLTDVLAAVSTARLTGLAGWKDVDLAAVHAAHQAAAVHAVTVGDSALAVRLMGEQAEVSAAALIGEEEAARQLGITQRSLNNLRLSYRTICPPVLIAGDQRTKWFWAPGQFAVWKAARPGRGWRAGSTGAVPPASPAGPSRRRGQDRGGHDRRFPEAVCDRS